jgi:hypothetical protein
MISFLRESGEPFVSECDSGIDLRTWPKRAPMNLGHMDLLPIEVKNVLDSGSSGKTANMRPTERTIALVVKIDMRCKEFKLLFDFVTPSALAGCTEKTISRI